jgi:hypothetical protein
MTTKFELNALATTNDDSNNVGAFGGMASALHRLERYPEALRVLDRAC